MPDVMDRVRVANPARVDEFEGRADFAALALPTPRRRRRRWLAAPVLAALAAAVVIAPASAPGAEEVMRRASAAIATGGDILYAQTRASRVEASGETADYGTRRMWVQGETVRWLQVTGTGDGPAGYEEVTRDGSTTRSLPESGKRETHPGMRLIAGDVFRVSEKLRSARAGKDVTLGEATLDGRDAYVLTWRERSGPPHWPVIELQLWVDGETYEPIKLVDHSWGKDAQGKPFDSTFTETVDDFEKLPDTPEHRKLLEMSRGR